MADVSKAPQRIAGMFDAIASRYDFLNHLLSAGIDTRWRRTAVQTLGLTGREVVLDLCTGTADLALASRSSRPGAARVIGVDFSAGMLAVARDKLDNLSKRNAHSSRGIALVRGDATQVPLPDRSVDAITIGFGIRNVDNTGAACAEMVRVLKPGGRLAILEFAIPTAPPVRALYLWYFNAILPRIGRLVSRHNAAYGYLPASVGAFATPDEFSALLRDAGFRDVKAQPLTLGIVVLYTARV